MLIFVIIFVITFIIIFIIFNNKKKSHKIPFLTPTPTPSITTIYDDIPIDYVQSVVFEVGIAGEIKWIDKYNNSQSEFYGIGPQVINDCIKINSLIGITATIYDINYSPIKCS